MLMLIHIDQLFAQSGKRDQEAPIGWTLDGRAFVIKSKDELVQTWLPQFFRHGKFQSFTRKLYRWGFRQVNLPRDISQEKRELVFANPHFQREKRSLMAHMKSVTAAGVRRQQKEQQPTESKLAERDEYPSVGLLGLNPPNFVDVIMANQARQPVPQASPLCLPNLSFASLGGGSTANTQLHQLLDPATRQLLLGQPRRERGPSLMDLYQQQVPQQVRLPSASSFNLHRRGSADQLALPQNFLTQPHVAPSPLQSLLDSATVPQAAAGSAGSAGLGPFGRDAVLQERLRELATHIAW